MDETSQSGPPFKMGQLRRIGTSSAFALAKTEHGLVAVGTLFRDDVFFVVASGAPAQILCRLGLVWLYVTTADKVGEDLQ